MTAEEESGFTFVDKRRVSRDPQDPTAGTQDTGAPSPDAATETAAEQAGDSTLPPMTEEDMAAHASGTIPRLSVRDRLLMSIDILNQGAWISLGLVSDPATGQIERDLAQAKTAIDSVAFLAGKVEGDLDEETRRELRNLVRDLQLNYVQQTSR